MRAAALPQRIWAACREPSLMRRLLGAQMLVLTLLWTLALGLLLADSGRGGGVLALDPLYDSLIVAAEGLAEQPERQRELLHSLDRSLRQAYGEGEEDSPLAPSLLVWQGGRVIYRSAGADRPLLQGRPDGVIEQLSGPDGRQWRVRTRQSAHSDTRVTLMLPGAWELVFTLSDRGLYLAPLFVSLPFLILPAWLSLRLALRPFRRVGRELEARVPQDLSPLAYRPQHAELRPLVQGVNTVLQRLRDSLTRERSLVADAAHELRTPLAALRINVEALRQHSVEPRQRALLDSLLRSNERATRLVGQLLQLMRSEAAAALPREPVVLDALLQERLAALEGLAGRRAVELELELAAATPLWVCGERESLISMLDNLIDNAIKYSPSGGTVRAVLVAAGARAELSLQDQGPGIPPALRGRVFDRFFRDPDQTQSGSGLGLAIVHAVLERHGGSIALGEAADGRGLRVTLCLPLHRAAGGSA